MVEPQISEQKIEVQDNFFELHLDEGYCLWLQKLNFKQHVFEQDFYKRTGQHKQIFKLKDDETMIGFVEQESGKLIEILSAKWDLIGIHTLLPNSSTPNQDQQEEKTEEETVVDVEQPLLSYQWAWPNHYFPDRDHSKLTDCLKKLPEELSYLGKPIIRFEDNMIISFLTAFLMEHLDLEYILLINNNDKSSVFGLSNIKWLQEPIPEILKELEDERTELQKEFQNPESEEQEEGTEPTPPFIKSMIDILIKK